jgi:uncharacterized protein with HEPN domain
MDIRDKRIFAKMRVESRLVADFIDQMDFEGYMRNEVIKRAVAMTLANIGELCGALSAEAKQKYQDIPWAAIRKTRNIISHDYESVNFSILWQTAITDIPALITKIDAIESDIGQELYGETEQSANYEEIMKAIQDAEENGE